MMGDDKPRKPMQHDDKEREGEYPPEIDDKIAAKVLDNPPTQGMSDRAFIALLDETVDDLMDDNEPEE